MKLRLLFSLFLTLMLFSVKAQIDTVGLIGSATPDGWNSDQTMVQDPDSSNLFTLDIHLTAGEAKFRANHDWAINWGSTSFPTGIGTQDGPNIPILAGQYHVSFNSTTGAYNFAVVSDIGIIGSATPDGWNSDVNMYRDEADTNAYYLRIDLVSGEAKFRQNDDWAVNWGAADFPTGIGVQNGPNIPIAQAGTYDVSFNKSTGAYNFIPFFTISTVGIVGSGTPGGNTETSMYQNGNIWTLSTHLSNGGLQFTINSGDAFWGGPDFPIGIATNGGGDIPVTEGNWQIELNTTTGAYTFYPIQIFDSVGLIGSATPGGWDTDSDMERSASDSSLWSLRIVLVDGEAKFRANHDWAVNWGAGDFPSGIGLRDGANIPVPAGEYIVTFNSITGAYNFKLLVLYDRVGLVGAGTPLQSWDIDFFLTKDANDENLWTYNSIDLNGEVKFRADSNWTVNWGATDFPSGIGTQDGPNIPVAAGTYGINFNSGTGEYVFGDPLATQDLLNPADILVYPNPASEQLYIDVSKTKIAGRVNLNVFDIQGKLLRSEVKQADDLIKLNVSDLQNGHYLLQITNDHYIIGKNFAVLK